MAWIYNARPIRIPIEWVQGKKITVQYNSNHAWPSTIFKHKRSFLRLFLGRTVHYNGWSVRYFQLWWTPCPLSVQYIEIDQVSPVSIFCGPVVGRKGRVCTHIKARKTATARGKITTIAAVSSAVVAPWLNLLFVSILLKIINFLSITVPSSPSSIIFF